MKLIFFGDAIAEHLRRWSRSFAGLGHEVHVITWNQKLLDGYGPVQVHKLEKPIAGSGRIARSINLLRLRVRVRGLIRQIRPDLIHAHSAGAYAWMAMFTRFHPFLITPWGDDILIHIHQSAIEKFFTVHALRHADLVHAEGEDTRAVLWRLGVATGRIVMMPLGLDVEKFRPGVARSHLQKKYGLEGRSVIISTRTLNPIHDVETTIRAASLVLMKVPDAKFLIIGGGVERGPLQELSESLGVGRSVVFTGHIEEDEMVACLQSADVYVSTSLSDSGTPASTAEAMSCGLPVISTDAGNIRSRIRDGEGGYLVPLKNPSIVAEKILYFLGDPKPRERAGKINRRHIKEHYDVRSIKRQMEAVYFNLISQSDIPGAKSCQR